MEVTKEFFEEQLKNLATKDDLKNFATKDDLKGLASKDDLDSLKKFVQTNMVTKQELDDRLDKLPTRADFSKLQQTVDGIAKSLQEQGQEQIVTASRSERMEAWIIEAAKKIGVQYKP